MISQAVRRAAPVGRWAHRMASRLRWPLALTVVWLWWMLLPPTSVTWLTAGLLAVVLGHRRLAPAQVRARRRATLRARVVLAGVAALMFGVTTPQVWADDPFGPLQQGDLCRIAPTPETSGTGLTGMLDPQNNLPMDGTAYGDRGFAGSFWITYDTGCINAAGGLLLGQLGTTITDSSQGNTSGADTMMGNLLLKVAKGELAVSTGMRARAMDPHYFDGLDNIMASAVDSVHDLLITPWIGLPIVVLGIILLTLARKGAASESMQRILVAVAGLGIIAFLGSYPLQAAKMGDQKIVDLQQQFDNGFNAKLPNSVIPIVQYCSYDYTQFDKPPVWKDGYQIVAGTPCTIEYRPTLNPSDQFTKAPDGTVLRYSPEFFTSGNFYAETMYANLIIPSWEQGLIGTDDRSGPNYDLAMQFLSGQSMTRFEIAADAYDTAAGAQAPAGSIWCSYVNNVQTCGRSQQGGAPGRIMSDTEANYRDAIQAAGDSRYPYIQGKAGNRVSSGAEAVAAVTAATPMQAASYTGVFAGRLLLRVYVIAGLIFGLGLILFPKLLRQVRNAVTSALATIVLLAAVGSLMSFLTLQLVANPAVYGKLGPTGGMIILAGISLLAVITIHPVRRIGQMLSTATTGDPNAIGNFRRSITQRVTRPIRHGIGRVQQRRSLRKVLGRGNTGGGGETENQNLDESYADGSGYEDDYAYESPRPETVASTAMMDLGPTRTGAPSYSGPRYLGENHAPRTESFGMSRPETPGRSNPLDRPMPSWDTEEPSRARAWSQVDKPEDPGAAPSRHATIGGLGRADSARSNTRRRGGQVIPADPQTEMIPIDAELVDDDAATDRPAPRRASRTDTGVYQITGHHDVFRPALQPGRRSAYALSSTTSETRSPIIVPRSDAAELIWRPTTQLPPAAPSDNDTHYSSRPEIGASV